MVSALAARIRPYWSTATARAAVYAGAALGKVGRSLPGTAGPLLVSLGLWMAWRPLGVVFAGAVLWALDRRV